MTDCTAPCGRGFVVLWDVVQLFCTLTEFSPVKMGFITKDLVLARMHREDTVEVRAVVPGWPAATAPLPLFNPLPPHHARPLTSTCDRRTDGRAGRRGWWKAEVSDLCDQLPAKTMICL